MVQLFEVFWATAMCLFWYFWYPNTSGNTHTFSIHPSKIDPASFPATEFVTTKKSPIWFMMVGDAHLFNENGRHYLNQKSYALYCQKHDCEFSTVDPKEYPMCNFHSNFFFRKQCAVLQILKKDTHEWIFVVDGDTFIVNYDNNWKNFRRDDASVVMYTRNHLEIMAGNYMIRPNEIGIKFLEGWTGLDKERTHPWANDDNTKLQVHLLRFMGIENKCEPLFWDIKGGWDDYFRDVVACFHCSVIKNNNGRYENVNGLTIERRDHAFATDDHNQWTDAHFIYHGTKDVKKNSNLVAVDSSEIDGRDAQKVSVNEFRKKLESGMNWRLGNYAEMAWSGKNSDIQHCWPECKPNLNQEEIDNALKHFHCDSFYPDEKNITETDRRK